MKILRFLPIAAIACVAVSCQNGGGSSLSENASQTDSLMYYLGQINGADYLREAERDTTFKESSEKQAFLSGIKAGLAALKEGNESYNRGVMQGIQMAAQMMNFCEQMDVDINKSSYINSLSSTVMGDTVPNVNNAQAEFRKVMQNMETAKKEKDQAESRESLKNVAASSKLPMISDDLYGKPTDNVTGDSIVDGTEITLVAVITNEKDETVNLPLPPKGKVGNQRNFPEVLSKALETLKSGQTGEFLTTAHALLGPRAMQMNLKPADVLKLKLTPTIAPSEEEKDKKADVAAEPAAKIKPEAKPVKGDSVAEKPKKRK